MVGSPVIGALIAAWGFWVLLLIGIVKREIGLTAVAIFVSLWLTGRLGLPYVPYDPLRGMFSSWVAALDIALVFRIFKGDVRLT